MDEKIKQRLNIGGGNLPLDGYTNIDKYYYPNSKWPLTNRARAEEWIEGKHEGSWVYGDALHLVFPDETFDEVMASHVLEHFSMEEGNLVLKEAWRVLKHGGFITVCLPDLAKACEMYPSVAYDPDGRDNSQWFYVMGMIYGTTGKDGEGQFHLCGYDRRFLKARFKQRDFERVEEVASPSYHKQEFNFCLRAYKK
jgi:predicted SAM-dependent methyltransferase